MSRQMDEYIDINLPSRHHNKSVKCENRNRVWTFFAGAIFLATLNTWVLVKNIVENMFLEKMYRLIKRVKDLFQFLLQHLVMWKQWQMGLKIRVQEVRKFRFVWYYKKNKDTKLTPSNQPTKQNKTNCH